MRTDIYKYQNKKFITFFPPFMEKIISDNKKILVVFADENKMQAMDKLLWEFNPDSWIPHLKSSDENAENATTVFTIIPDENTNNAETLCAIDTPIKNTNIEKFTRSIYFFDADKNENEDFINGLKIKSDNEFHLYVQHPTGKWIEE